MPYNVSMEQMAGLPPLGRKKLARGSERLRHLHRVMQPEGPHGELSDAIASSHSTVEFSRTQSCLVCKIRKLYSVLEGSRTRLMERSL